MVININLGYLGSYSKMHTTVATRESFKVTPVTHQAPL